MVSLKKGEANGKTTKVCVARRGDKASEAQKTQAGTTVWGYCTYTPSCWATWSSALSPGKKLLVSEKLDEDTK